MLYFSPSANDKLISSRGGEDERSFFHKSNEALINNKVRMTSRDTRIVTRKNFV